MPGAAEEPGIQNSSDVSGVFTGLGNEEANIGKDDIAMFVNVADNDDDEDDEYESLNDMVSTLLPKTPKRKGEDILQTNDPWSAGLPASSSSSSRKNASSEDFLKKFSTPGAHSSSAMTQDEFVAQFGTPKAALPCTASQPIEAPIVSTVKHQIPISWSHDPVSVFDDGPLHKSEESARSVNLSLQEEELTTCEWRDSEPQKPSISEIQCLPEVALDTPLVFSRWGYIASSSGSQTPAFQQECNDLEHVLG